MTIRGVYQKGVALLEEAGIAEASLDAWYLLEYVTGMSRATFLADGGRELKEADAKAFLELIRKRGNRIPLQHITGVQEFMGLDFCVNEHVLIPRQDTEVLVELALERMKSMNREGSEFQILDMCTGSGCILLSTLYYARQEKNGDKVFGTGVDVSTEALKVARRNAEQLKIDSRWLESDLFSEVEGKYDMILSNPPYIPSKVIETLEPEVREHDPMLALDGKEDGLYFYRSIIAESRSYLKKGAYLIFEIGAEQGASVSGLMKEAGFCSVEVKKDLAGLDRVVLGVYDTF